MNPKINSFFKQTSIKFKDLLTIALTTTDGFPIYSDVKSGSQKEDEKVAAISSSLISLSNAAARQLLDTNLKSTTIETDKGNIFLSNTMYDNKKCVLCVITGTNENIGHARYFTQLIADHLHKQ